VNQPALLSSESAPTERREMTVWLTAIGAAVTLYFTLLLRIA
jgi:hypothetical protein